MQGLLFPAIARLPEKVRRGCFNLTGMDGTWKYCGSFCVRLRLNQVTRSTNEALPHQEVGGVERFVFVSADLSRLKFCYDFTILCRYRRHHCS